MGRNTKAVKMYEYIRSCKVKDLSVCAQKEVNVTKSMSAGIQVSQSCGMYGIHGDSKKGRGLLDGKDYGQPKYTGSNTSRASQRGREKNVGGGGGRHACPSTTLPAFYKLGYLYDRQMSQSGAERYSYS